MSRVLHVPRLEGAARVVSSVDPALDPVLQELMERTAEQARQEGFEAGRQQGRSEGRQHVQALADQVATAMADLTRAVRSMRIEQATGTAELATAVAAHVLDREPSDQGQALLQRVHTWLSEIDDGPVELAVSQADADVVEAAFKDNGDVEVVVDEALTSGEVRLDGAWAHAELTRAARWEEIREALDDA